MQLDACSRGTSYTCNGNFVSKYIGTAVTRTVMAALVWAGSRRVPSRISKIWAHAELTSMGFGYPNPTPPDKKAMSAQHFQCILFYWTFYFIFKLFLPFLYQVHYNLCNALKQYRNQCIFLQKMCQTFYTCM